MVDLDHKTGPGPGSARRKVVTLLALPSLVALGLLYYSGALGDNFREIIPGKLYRSAQPDPEMIQNLSDQYGIRSIINLRGGEDKEIETSVKDKSEAIGLSYYVLGFRSDRLPPPVQLNQLIQILKQAPQPVLIHCKAGSDRTGMASAIYLIVVVGVEADQAAEQLTWRYGHLPLGDEARLDQFFDLYSESGDGASFEDWAANIYPAIYRRITGRTNDGRLPKDLPRQFDSATTAPAPAPATGP